MSRRLEREIAFKYIYERLFNDEPDFLHTLSLINEESAKKSNEIVYDGFAKDLYSGVLNNLDDINYLIEQNLEGYSLERVYKVDLALLLLAVYEINHLKTDPKIVINEIIELSKIYSDDKSPSFINGVLSRIVNKK